MRLLGSLRPVSSEEFLRMKAGGGVLELFVSGTVRSFEAWSHAAIEVFGLSGADSSCTNFRSGSLLGSLALAACVVACAINVRRLFHCFALGAAIFGRRHTRANGVGALLERFARHIHFSWLRIKKGRSETPCYGGGYRRFCIESNTIQFCRNINIRSRSGRYCAVQPRFSAFPCMRLTPLYRYASVTDSVNLKSAN
jgi:hypothetical protein